MEVTPSWSSSDYFPSAQKRPYTHAPPTPPHPTRQNNTDRSHLFPVPEAQRELPQELIVRAVGIRRGPNRLHLLFGMITRGTYGQRVGCEKTRTPSRAPTGSKSATV